MIATGKGRNFRASLMERKSVTVCIAAACFDEASNEHKIVLCTDWRISSGLGSAEVKLKQRNMASGWLLLTAGEDSEINAFERLLSITMRAASKIDDTNAPKLVREAIAGYKRQKIEDFIQGQYGMPYDDFLALGRDKLNPEAFRDALYAVRDIPIEADFILAGFSSGYPLLIQTEGASKITIRDIFAVAGEGGYLAQTVMLNRAHMDVHSLARTIYSVYEAKRYAEGATSVGKITALQVMSPDGTQQYLRQAGFKALEKQYEKYGPQTIPDDLKAIDPSLFESNKANEQPS